MPSAPLLRASSRQTGSPPLNHRPTSLCNKAGSTSGVWQRRLRTFSRRKFTGGSGLVLAGWSPLLSALLQVSRAVVIRGVGDPTGKDLFVQRQSFPFGGGGTLLRLNLGVFFSPFPFCSLLPEVNDLLNGAPDQRRARSWRLRTARGAACKEQDSASPS